MLDNRASRWCVHGSVIAVRLLSALLALSLQAHAFARLTPAAAGAFDRYIEQAEAGMNNRRQAESFLHVDAAERPRLRGGEVIIERAGPSEETKVPGGMIQDWRGAMFIPSATISTVKSVLQDYEHYKEFYKPDVIDSRQLSRHDDEYDIFLRLYKKQILTAVLNSEYHVRYEAVDARHLAVISRSTRIAEVRDPKKSFLEEHAVGDDTGFLWRLNSYWRFEEADGGVYAECEAISLSRDVPLGLGWMIKGFISKFPKESMQNTLRGTKAAVQNHSGF